LHDREHCNLYDRVGVSRRQIWEMLQNGNQVIEMDEKRRLRDVSETYLIIYPFSTT